ncbi:MAG: ABC transporter permease [Bacteriovoracia bacterium]
MSKTPLRVIWNFARRFVFERKSVQSSIDSEVNHGFVSFISSISIAGLSLGVTALLVVTSVMNGFEKELFKVLTAFHGHVLLFSRSEPVSASVAEQIKQQSSNIKAVSPYIFAEAMLSTSSGIVGAVLEGIDRSTIDSVSEITKKIQVGTLPEKSKDPNMTEVVLGSEVSRKLKASIGDTVLLTVPFMKANDSPLVKKLKVVGIIKIGMHDYDKKYAILEQTELQQILEIPGKVNAFKILTDDPNKSNQITALLNDKFTYPLRARDWSSLNRNLFYAIRLEKVVISIILLAIVLVASFNVISTILMLVQEKKQQVSILKAMGLSSKKTLTLFLTIGILMASMGIFLGLVLGRSLCAILAWKSIIDLPADIYMFSRLPVEIRVSEWVMVCVGVFLLAVCSAFLPSLRVSRESAVEGLRYE